MPDEVVERFTIAITLDRGIGDVWKVENSVEWQASADKADAMWCAAMQIIRVLQTLRQYMNQKEWDEFVVGIQGIGDEV